MNIKTPKKLIEVALPLDDINVACTREKSIRHGHPSTLHLWWARRPLAAARAVIFAQMVNDPGYERGLGRGVNKEKAQIERERLFGIIRKLVLWENTNNEAVLTEARDEIWKSWRETCELNRSHPDAAELFNPGKLPAFHDPFAGGGAIPLEAQRLGLESHASDLNPVAVLINKAMIEIPSKFSGNPPVGPFPVATGKKDRTYEMHEDWAGPKGLAEDVRRYGLWMKDEAFRRIGHIFPKVFLPKELGSGEATVIAWLGSRTVKCPNPACGITMPLMSSFILSSKKGKESYVLPTLESDGKITFKVQSDCPEKFGDPSKGFKRGLSGIFECISCKTITSRNYVAEQAIKVGLGTLETAIVCEGKNGRIYLPANYIPPQELPPIDNAGLTIKLSENPRDVWCRNFGLITPADLFTNRQLVALTTLSDLIKEVRLKVKSDVLKSNKQNVDLEEKALAYADAISVYLTLSVNKVADRCSIVCGWDSSRDSIRNTFGRQAIPMVWDYAESNCFSDSSGSFANALDQTVKSILMLMPGADGFVVQADAQNQTVSAGKVISTDPPYYDNIGYADLSDFFYVWMRRSLRGIYPDLFATMAVPKVEELVALPYRHVSKRAAEKFFLDGMTEAMHRLAQQAHPCFPTTIYYAFKQSDTTDVGTGNTGWETFLEAVLAAGFAICGTWPMRTEMSTRMVSSGTNALASSIVLVCQQREANAPTVSRREFLRELKVELRDAVEVMIGGAEGLSPVAPVDLAQAVIGPGMAIFSKYSAVLEADGRPMTVHSALIIINKMLTEGGDEFDADTQFCLAWFDEHSWVSGEFGKADVLARAKGTSVDGVRDAGVVEAGSGKVRLLKPVEYPADWNPEEDNRTPVWEALHHLIRALQSQGESAAGVLLARMPELAEHIRSLAYRLYTLCERKGWADEARGYNELITSWLGIEAASHEAGHIGGQAKLDI
ncbi:MAG: DUF1156 domain-containing protein [Methylotenera sp.]|nr:DUF1156 domain-containing protein [Methylotenera sp.]MDP2404593.1 DUF1156 domain-containing protein [Methylotenera sp.]MDP3094363.1 DUF1156 domain-containing protein [Methylotenera sp.]MDZ4222205.1 DUF1156 domain-containing protein [Methylotenera sp.]